MESCCEKSGNARRDARDAASPSLLSAVDGELTGSDVAGAGAASSGSFGAADDVGASSGNADAGETATGRDVAQPIVCRIFEEQALSG